MKITVFGATGLVGEKIVSQALAIGWNVTAFGRNVDKLIDKDSRNELFTAIKGYVFDEHAVSNAIKNADAIISVIEGRVDVTDKSRSLGMKNIIAQMQKIKVKRIVALGGIGILNADADHYILDTPDYPPEFKDLGQEQLLSYLFLQASSLDWTYVCPPSILAEEGNHHYTTSADYLPQPNNNEIAIGDLSDFILTELIQNKYLRHRVGISRL